MRSVTIFKASVDLERSWIAPSSPFAMRARLVLGHRDVLGAAQELRNLAVPLVDIGAELDRAVRIGESGLVDEEYRQRRRQRPAMRVVGCYFLVDRVDVLLQQQRGELARVLDAHATVAQ